MRQGCTPRSKLALTLRTGALRNDVNPAVVLGNGPWHHPSIAPNQNRHERPTAPQLVGFGLGSTTKAESDPVPEAMSPTIDPNQDHTTCLSEVCLR